MEAKNPETKMFDGNAAPEEVLAEIQRDISRINPNIGSI